MKILRRCLLLASLGISVLCFAGEMRAQEAPDVMVRRITEDVMETAKTDAQIKAGNRRRIHELVREKILPHIDLERATALTVGRHWREATPQQQRQLIDEFRALLMYTYAGALSQIRDQKLIFKPMRGEPGDTEVEVRFEVRLPRKPEPVQVSYRMYKAADGWKVYDVNVLGVWLGETYRSSFAQEISRGGIDGLIKTLHEKNRTLAQRPVDTGQSS